MGIEQPRRNVELKARAADPDALEARARSLADAPSVELQQRDVFFRTQAGRLKLRTQLGTAAELIYYERPDASGPTESRYVLVPVPDPEALEALLAAAMGVRAILSKRRILLRVGQTRVHLDRVEGLGAFCELEVVLRPEQTAEMGTKIALDLMERLGIRPSDLVAEAYVDLLERAAEGDSR